MATTGDRFEDLPEVTWAQGIVHTNTRLFWEINAWRRLDEQLPPGRYVIRSQETGEEYPMEIKEEP